MFISFAHESGQHREVKRDLWVSHRSRGIDAKLDPPTAERQQDWPLRMADQDREADHVLVIASLTYQQVADGRARPENSRGRCGKPGWSDAFYAYPHALGPFVQVPVPGGVPRFLAPPSSATGLGSSELHRDGHRVIAAAAGQQPGRSNSARARTQTC